MVIKPIIEDRDIIVSDESGDARVIIDRGIAHCTCGNFRVNRTCKHIEFLSSNGYSFSIKRRQKDGYDYFLKLGESMLEAMDKKWK